MTITVNYYPKRTQRFSYGLGQDVGNLKSLVNMLRLFVPGSKMQEHALSVMSWRVSDESLKQQLIDALKRDPVELTVTELTAEYKKVKGKTASFYIKSILAAIIPGQNNSKEDDGSLRLDKNGQPIKQPMRQWPMRNFVSVGIGLGLLSWNRVNGKVSATSLGLKLANSQHLSGDNLSEEEISTLQLAFMSYPYAVGFLRAMEHETKGLNKFQLGEKFGFAGEGGFSSFGEHLYIESLKDAYESGNLQLVKEIRANWEGSSDKYIRGLAAMMGKINLVHTENKDIPYRNKKGLEKSFSIPAYKITGEGRKYLGYALGRSRHRRTEKVVSWDMLATKGNIVYIRTVRAMLLKELQQSTKGLSAIELADRINSNKNLSKPIIGEDKLTADEIVDHITGLNGIGLQIDDLPNGKYQLKDPIVDFEIPVVGTDMPHKDNIQRQQDAIRPLLRKIDHRYLQLIDLALDSSQNSEYSQLESLTMELILKHLNFKGKAMGGSRKPDGIAWDEAGNFLVVDTKAYDDGYSLAGNTDKVARYIDDVRARDSRRASTWWHDVPRILDVHKKLKFVYVSGYFRGEYVHLLNDLRARTSAPGGLLSVEKLLLTSELYLREKSYTHNKMLTEWTDDSIEHEKYFANLKNKLA